MKFLKTIRFDLSDAQVFEVAAEPDEWAMPGGFAFANLEPGGLTGKAKQAFSNAFLSLESYGHSTFAAVSEITADQLQKIEGRLVDHLQAEFGAPDRTEALVAAKPELEFVIDLCRDLAINTVFTVRRTWGEDKQIREEFRTISPPQEQAHTRVWEIVGDDDNDNDKTPDKSGANP